MTATNEENRGISSYLGSIRATSRLDKEEELRVARSARDGRVDALHALVEANLGFVVKVAKQYRSLGLPFEDLLNEGNLGLIRAATRFDPDRGTKFITYAIWWIRKAILEALSASMRIVRLPDRYARETRKANAAESVLRSRLGRAPSREELSEHLGTPLATLDEMRWTVRAPIELDRPVKNNEQQTLTETLSDDGASAEAGLIRREMLDGAARVFARLTPREQEVLALRLGLTGDPPQTLAVVGERLGLSRERIRQIEVNARRSLRRMLTRSDGTKSSRLMR
jgi:RNA polymerase primary sigma factor